MSASVISGSDAPPIFDPSEHVFYFVSLFIEFFIVSDFMFSVFAWRDTWFYILVLKRCPEFV